MRTVAVRFAALGACAWVSAWAPLSAQELDGEELFRAHCLACHNAAGDERAPSPEALGALAPEFIVFALTTGAMRLEGSRIGGAERRAIAEHLTGRAVGGSVDGADVGRCSTAPGRDLGPEAAAASPWSAWGATNRNTRFVPAEGAGLTAEDLPDLTLRWALGYPDATHAWGQPTVAAGRLYVGSQNGTVYALDADTGCIHWTFVAGGGVRTAIVLGSQAGGSGTAAYLGDTNATAYALDAATGEEIWRVQLDDHPLARITGSPAVHGGRLYVPTSSYEEVGTANPSYGCCTFRGSVTALDAETGDVLWKTYTVDEPRPRGESLLGVTLWGPSGGAIWTSPTVDPERGLVYASTGNAYSEPAGPLTNAVIAFDMDTGDVAWSNQTEPDDVFIGGCPRNHDNPNCPEEVGPDFDFGNPPILATLPDGREAIVIGQKSGVAYAMDPDDDGRILWRYRASPGSALGGLQYGSAVDERNAYFPVSDILLPEPGGLHAVDLVTGERVWYAPPSPVVCDEAGAGCNAAQAAAVTVIPGAVFSGSNDGALRAYSTADGTVLWEFDTNRAFATVNGVEARGASILGPGPTVAGGMVFVNSGYGSHGGRAGNVLLAFGRD